ncbi:hypothetical protein BXZ70DRAFT_90317 [Cristinia sonorae]|uniref:Uncharacterized protein n=1 Tax=Cristinia sonorae TaxID=1940300 RepID=A0A8K0XQJ7_9AGAR|nr:hypothetical protein BXZ70DRAFT_90317 [Cristinia sonorae]
MCRTGGTQTMSLPLSFLLSITSYTHRADETQVWTTRRNVNDSKNYCESLNLTAPSPTHSRKYVSDSRLSPATPPGHDDLLDSIHESSTGPCSVGNGTRTLVRRGFGARISPPLSLCPWTSVVRNEPATMPNTKSGKAKRSRKKNDGDCASLNLTANRVCKSITKLTSLVNAMIHVQRHTRQRQTSLHPRTPSSFSPAQPRYNIHLAGTAKRPNHRAGRHHVAPVGNSLSIQPELTRHHCRARERISVRASRRHRNCDRGWWEVVHELAAELCVETCSEGVWPTSRTEIRVGGSLTWTCKESDGGGLPIGRPGRAGIARYRTSLEKGLCASIR